MDEVMHPGRRLPAVQDVAMLTGGVFVVVGILGFIPGVTQHLSVEHGLKFSGTASDALLFGLFATSVLHQGIFLLSGALGAVGSFFTVSARLFFAGIGVLFAFLAVFGFVVDQSSSANFLPFNTADDILHLVLAAVLLGFAVLLPTGEADGHAD